MKWKMLLFFILIMCAAWFIHTRPDSRPSTPSSVHRPPTNPEICGTWYYGRRAKIQISFHEGGLFWQEIIFPDKPPLAQSGTWEWDEEGQLVVLYGAIFWFNEWAEVRETTWYHKQSRIDPRRKALFGAEMRDPDAFYEFSRQPPK